MKLSVYSILILFLLALTIGCAGSYHKTPMPDPASFNAHFGDMDTDGDDLVSQDEFNTFFKNPDPNVFKTIDMNGDGAIDHDEWHKFKEAHGLKHAE